MFHLVATLRCTIHTNLENIAYFLDVWLMQKTATFLESFRNQSTAINQLPLAINSQSNHSIQELVMEMCSDLWNTARNVAGYRLYSSVETAENV